MQSNDGKIILVTGGSRGLGAEIVKKLAQNKNHCIYLTYLKSREKAEKLAFEHANVNAVKCDQKDDGAVKKTIETILLKNNKLDVLINNACPSFRPCDFINTRWEDFQEILDVNLMGAYLFSREAASIMKEYKNGKIINILSDYVINAPPSKISHYITSKYALMGLSKACAAELSKYGIRVNMISPGIMKTDMTGHMPKKYFEYLEHNHPLKRLTTTADAASVVEFLISENSAFLNGTNIVVNGGERF